MEKENSLGESGSSLPCVCHAGFFQILVPLSCHLPMPFNKLSQPCQKSPVFPSDKEGHCGSGFLWDWMFGKKIIITHQYHFHKSSKWLRRRGLGEDSISVSVLQPGAACAIFSLVSSCCWPVAGFHTRCHFSSLPTAAFSRRGVSSQADTQRQAEEAASAQLWLGGCCGQFGVLVFG